MATIASEPHQCHVSAGSEASVSLSLIRSTDDHGRPLTATPEASAWYRKAQQSSDLEATKQALRRALECDPGFGLAYADLSLLAETGPGPAAIGMHAWERHYIEIVCSVQRH
jgi:hypothetical protein